MTERITIEVVLVIAMLCITCLGSMALIVGLDGTAFGTVIASIVTIAGYLFAKEAIKKE